MVRIEINCEELTIFSGFSPNGDGINDRFTIKGIENFPDNEVSVFNRWGNEIYREQAYNNETGWDGTFNGDLIPDGTYFYLVQIKGKEPISGYVQLQR